MVVCAASGVFRSILFRLLFHGLAIAIASSNVPIQVFILGGQSNMVGKGSIRHLDRLIQSNTSEYRAVLWNDHAQAYKVRTDVYVRFGDEHGYLTVSRTAGLAANKSFGPEVMIGHTIGDSVQNATLAEEIEEDDRAPTVLLIKVAYGSRSLAVDFRPPSAGIGNYADVVNASIYGWQYRIMMEDIHNALSNMTAYVPGYNSTVGYELRGFIWFQGWNDVLDWATVKEYESNLVHFIRDVRSELQAPDLPFVVGELGMHGEDPVGDGAHRALALRAAQRQACAAMNATKYVPTAQYAVLNGTTTYDGIHHYFGRADTVFHIGRALGEGMLELMEEEEEELRIKDATSQSSNTVWINEFHYNSNDTNNAFVEIAHTISLSGYNLLWYHGDSIVNCNISLTGTVPHSTVNAIQYTVVEYASDPGISSDIPTVGCALADPNHQVVEFLSYDGILTTEGGMVSTNVGVMENDRTPANHSLQKCPESHIWTGPLPNTKGQPNTVNCTAILPAPTSTGRQTKVLLLIGSCTILGLAALFFWSNRPAFMKH